jgi:phosphate transport system protein
MSEEKRIVKSYEEEMQSLNDDLVKMGSLTESQLSDTIQAIVKIDKEAAENIVKNDAQINELRAKIDDQISTVLVKRAPMAIDLRTTISSLKISHDLERIGDLAKSVAKKIEPLPIDLPQELTGSLKRLGELVQKQLNNVLDAYITKSKDKAVDVWRNDEQVDDLTHIAMNEVANFLGKNKKNLELATHLLFVTKNIERAGDHVTNIAESLYYLIEGEYLEGARPKGKEFVKDK